jgi:hypothetical protein
MASCHKDSTLEHDVDWLLDQCDTPDKAVLALTDDAGQCVALFVHDGEIGLSLGELQLGSFEVRRHVLVGNYPQYDEAEWEQILVALHSSLGTRSAVYLMGVVDSESLYLAIRSKEIRRLFWVSPHGQSYLRRLFEVGESLDTYLQSLPSTARKDLRRSLRRFRQRFGDQVEVEIFRSPDEVESFLRKVEPVSARTYQARLLDQHVTLEGFIGRKAMRAAQRGWTRCYLLSCGGEPLAWRIGFLYQGTFFSHHVGYNPEYAKWHPGVVMHLYTVAALAREGRNVQLFDFLFGDNSFKQRASTLARPESSYYLLPKNGSGTARFFALTASNWVSESLGWLLERFGLKQDVKRFIRRSIANDS